MVHSYNGIMVQNSGDCLRYIVNRKKQDVELCIIFYSLCKTEKFMYILACMQASVWKESPENENIGCLQGGEIRG